MADNLFSNKMQNLDILRYSNDESYVNYIKHLSVKTAVKNGKCPSLVTTQNKC